MQNTVNIVKSIPLLSNTIHKLRNLVVQWFGIAVGVKFLLKQTVAMSSIETTRFMQIMVCQKFAERWAGRLSYKVCHGYVTPMIRQFWHNLSGYVAQRICISLSLPAGCGISTFNKVLSRTIADV